ncbi:DUF6542 domain-containing protein [Corynebacterium choanae]|uniref:DUF6542 domain-containing protein n=1 Tax=Corynebacterium choanae TaxID=1862358 RepID=UPI000F50A916
MNQRPQVSAPAGPAVTVRDVGVSPAIATLVLFTGTGLAAWQAIDATRITMIFVMLFGIGAVLSVSMVKTSAVYLQTTLIPIIFGLVVPLTAGYIGSSMASADDSRISKTDILTSLYPLAQHFPSLLAITGIATAIAVLRWWLAHRRYKDAVVRARRAHAVDRAADKDNVSTARTARRAARRPRPGDASAVTVDQLSRERRERRARLQQRSTPTTAVAANSPQSTTPGSDPVPLPTRSVARRSSATPQPAVPGRARPRTPVVPPAAPQPFHPHINPATPHPVETANDPQQAAATRRRPIVRPQQPPQAQPYASPSAHSAPAAAKPGRTAGPYPIKPVRRLDEQDIAQRRQRAAHQYQQHTAAGRPAAPSHTPARPPARPVPPVEYPTRQVPPSQPSATTPPATRRPARHTWLDDNLYDDE